MSTEPKPSSDRENELIDAAFEQVSGVRASGDPLFPSLPTEDLQIHTSAFQDSLDAQLSPDKPLTDSIPGYEILREIHRGGQGVVYQAIQKSTKRRVAIKVMREGPFAGRHDQIRFEREVQVLGALNHPNIVSIHDSGTAAGSFYYVMDYISGQPLDVWMASRQRSVDEILRMFARICEAVNAAHLRGVIHRDLKPGNIRIDAEDNPYILDFGLAKMATGQVTDESRPQVMTITGQFVGSLPWASPEQAEGVPTKIDTRTDVYALGVILYQMLTSQFPYQVVGNMRDVLDNIIRAEPARPSTIRKQINDEVETIVLKCLSKERERRYQTAGELARDVGRYLAAEPIEAKRDSALYMIRKNLRRYRIPVAIAAGFVVLLVAGLTLTSTLYYRANYAFEREREQREVAQQKTKEALAAQAAEQHARHVADEERMKSDRLSYAALIAAADNQIKNSQLGKASETLAACPPACRNWEWGWLSRLSTTAIDLRKLDAHKGPAWTIAFSPDNKLLATGGQDGMARIWHLETGELRTTIRAGCDSVRCVTFSPDGKTILTSGGNRQSSTGGTIRFWETDTGKLSREFDAHNHWVWSTAFSPDGKYLATGSADMTAKLWDAHTFKEQRTFAGHTSTVFRVAFSSDGKNIITSSGPDRGNQDDTVRVWSIESGNERYSKHSTRPGGIAPAPQGQHLAISSWGRIITLLDLTADEVAKDLALPLRPLVLQEAGPVAFNTAGTRLAAGTDQGMLYLLDLTTGQDIFARRAHEKPVTSVAFSPDDRWLASAGEDGQVRLWEIASPPGDAAIASEDRYLETLAFSPDCTHFAVGSVEGSVELRDTQTGRMVWHSPPGQRRYEINRVLFHPDGHQLGAVCSDGKFRLWEPRHNRQVLELGGDAAARAAAFSPDGKKIVVGAREGNVMMWATETGQRIDTLQEGEGGILSAAFSHDGSLLAGSAGGMEGGALVRVWDAHSGRLLYKLPAHIRGTWTVLFSPDDKFLFAGSLAGVVHVLESRTGKYITMLNTEQTDMCGLAVNPDGRRLATGSEHELRIWDTATWQLLVTLNVYGNNRWCQFSGNGRTLGAVGHNGMALIRTAFSWDTREYPGDEQTPLEQRFELYKRQWMLDQRPDGLYRDAAEFKKATELGELSLGTLTVAGHSEEEYRKALDQAAAAHRIAPDNPYYLRTEGIGLYRLGRYAEAVEALKESNRITGGLPSTTSFLAMSYHRLNQPAEADAAMKRLCKLMLYPQWVCRSDVKAFYDQALDELGQPSEKSWPGLTQADWHIRFFVWDKQRPVMHEDNWKTVLATTPVAEMKAECLCLSPGYESPCTNVPTDYFGTVATALLEMKDAGRYRICARADDGVRVWINDQLVIDKWVPQAANLISMEMDLPSGQHPVRIEHFEEQWGAVLVFWIEPASGPDTRGN